MEILVLNLGSSSIKFKLFDMKVKQALSERFSRKNRRRNRAIENQIAFTP